MSNPVVSVSRLDIGPCSVKLGTQDIGATLDNVVVNFAYHKAPMKADQFGDSLLDEAIMGMEVTIETSFAQTRSKDIMAVLFPNLDLAGVDPADYLDMFNKVPNRQLALALQLKLHPLVEADAGLNYDWTFYKVVPSEESSYAFSPGEQGKMKIVFKVYLDTSVSPARVFRYGDASL